MSQILYGKPVAENLDFKSKTIFENYTTNNDKPPVLTAVSYTHLTLPTICSV